LYNSLIQTNVYKRRTTGLYVGGRCVVDSASAGWLWPFNGRPGNVQLNSDCPGRLEGLNCQMMSWPLQLIYGIGMSNTLPTITDSFRCTYLAFCTVISSLDIIPSNIDNSAICITIANIAFNFQKQSMNFSVLELPPGNYSVHQLKGGPALYPRRYSDVRP
jgi:hypothetical protein